MKASVLIITYNHEKYIAKALDGVLRQQTDFAFEIVVGEDCSTDATRDILTDYARRYPGRFRLLLHRQNVGGPENFEQTFNACTGEYLALLNGDDYWTSAHKLQSQVDLLDKHRECAVCFHDARIIYEDGSKEPTSYRPSQKSISTVEDLFLDNFIPTSAVMFRRANLDRVPPWLSTLKMGDWPLHILNALHGNVCYLNESMADYIVHRRGVWSTKDWRDHEPAIIELFEALLVHLDPKYAGAICKVLRWRNFTLSERFNNCGDMVSARRHAVKALIKHVRLSMESLRRGRTGSNGDDSMSAQLQSITASQLLKRVSRLCILPYVEQYPAFYKFLKTTARALNMSI